MNPLEAANIIAEMIEGAGLPLTPYHKQFLTLYRAGERGQSDSVYIEFDNFLFGGSASIRIPNIGNERFSKNIKIVEISWSSTNRTVSNSVAALELYRKVVALAAQIQAFFETTKIEEKAN